MHRQLRQDHPATYRYILRLYEGFSSHSSNPGKLPVIFELPNYVAHRCASISFAYYFRSFRSVYSVSCCSDNSQCYRVKGADWEPANIGSNFFFSLTFNSSAAFLENVQHRMAWGSMPLDTRCEYRPTNVVVFPVPGPARTKGLR